jgi:hypothetical protein
MEAMKPMRTPCAAENCEKPSRHGAYCSRHARQIAVHGQITNTLPSYKDPNAITSLGDLATIQLLKKDGQVAGLAVIDADAVNLARPYKWHLKNNGYVQSKGKSGTFYLHRLITGASPLQVVDHVDGNPMNNCRSNLRVCTQSDNLANRGANKPSKTGEKGVFPYKGGPRFAAQITRNRKVFSLGVFNTVAEAKAAYDAKAKELFGEYAKP